jgi:hypothetical protein
MRSVFFLVIASTLALSSVGAAGCAATPSDSTGDGTGSGEDNLTSQDRAAVMDALRAKVKPDANNQDIVFNVQGEGGALRDAGGFAFLQGKVQLRNGGVPTTNGTIFAGDANEGLFDGWHIEALLQKKPGGWTVLQHGVGSTDMWWFGIDESYPAAPKSIFPYLDGQTQQVAPTERASIMNGLRAEVKPEANNQDIVFNVQGDGGMFNVKSGYCWLQGQVQLRGGGEPTTNGTVFQEAASGGLFDGWRIEALLKKEGNAWTVLAHGIGTTDVWYTGLAERFPDAPKAILPQGAGGTHSN